MALLTHYFFILDTLGVKSRTCPTKTKPSYLMLLLVTPAERTKTSADTTSKLVK